MPSLTKTAIHKLFRALDDELATRKVRGDVYVVGGAVMCMVFDARESTVDVDALFKPTAELRAAAKRVAKSHDVDERWLNDAAKGLLSPEGVFAPYLQLDNLTVFAAQADYLLAMKCLAMRLGPEFHDESDIRYLLRYLNIETYKQAIEVIARFYPIDRFPQKTLYALQELLSG